MIPELLTPRLRLRGPLLADFVPRAAYFASPRATAEGGPFDEATAWRLWTSDFGQWLVLDYGPFSVESRSDGAYLGEAGIYHSRDYPDPELGWFLVPEAEGRGFATEAAGTVLAWLRSRFGWPRVLSYIAPDNARSIALGLRIGGVIDPTLPGRDPDDVVIRHDLATAR